MSITSYSELQSAITRWIARDDMAANIPDWIALFEAAANRQIAGPATRGDITLLPQPEDFCAAN